MLSASRFAVVLFGITPLFACDEEPGCGPYTDPETGKEHAPCSGLGEETAPLCDGSSSLRFAGTHAGGNLTGAPRVAAEVGWSFLLIDGECRYWAMTDPHGPVRTGTLDAVQEDQFSSTLRLGEWNADDEQTGGCVDAGSTRLRFGETQVSISCVVTPLTMAYSDWLKNLHLAGTRASGALRYTVSDASEESWVVGNSTDIASAWPLEGAPEDLLERGEDESAEPAVASADAAEALRDARDAYVARRAATGPWLRIPMVLEAAGADPRYFDVAMRDVTPFEREGALRVDEFFAR
jgi:hypothetical protein